ncbi:phospho-sugar mutase [Leucobacter sp. GX24907]
MTETASAPDAGSPALLAEPRAPLEVARAWAEHDPDDETRAALHSLIARVEQESAAGEPASAEGSSDDTTEGALGGGSALAELTEAFAGRLAFGTAGLRAELGPGPRRMNRVVVSQTSAGFAEYLRSRTDSPSVVIGYDGRVNSDVFARDAAEIMAGAGVSVTLLPGPLPTPVTAFAVRELGVSAGVMITASHNPPRDNGYKVYLGDADGGSQIIPPADSEIAARIAQVAESPVSELPRSSDYIVAGEAVADAYVAAGAEAVRAGWPCDPDQPDRPLGAGTPLRVVYTAMHGVGSATARRVFERLRLPEVVPVPEQDEPDGAFPTVAFPNPEEPGALDLAYRTARETDAEVIIAHDPDADRLAVALPHPDEASGYRRLSGNELGLLLGWRAAERASRAARAARAAGDELPRGALACTVVSSPALGAVAREYGLDYSETLSGFKWVSRVPGLVFGFEEALGYLTHPDVLRDKDGILASADALAMVREAKLAGRTLWDLLDEAAERFGHFASSQITVRLDSMVAADELSQRVRADPPRRFGAVDVASADDLLLPGRAAVPANVLRYDLADGSRVMIRPSGTEPKLKIYLDVLSRTGNASERRASAERSLATLETAVHAYLRQASDGAA